jgi:Protein of unknown function (DUF2783)
MSQNGLTLVANFADADGFYETLVLHLQDKTVEQAYEFNNRLLLVLANHIGDSRVLTEAIAAVSSSYGKIDASDQH